MSAAVPARIQTRAANGNARNAATSAVQMPVNDSVVVAIRIGYAAMDPRLKQLAPPHSRKFATNEAMVGKVAIGLASSAPKPV